MKELLSLATERSDLVLRQLHGEHDAQAVLDAIEENRPYLVQHGDVITPSTRAGIQQEWSDHPEVMFMGLWQNETELKTEVCAWSFGNSIVEIGYWTRYSAQGNGFASIAVRSLSTYLHEHYDHVIAQIHPKNEASGRVLHNAGFAYRGLVDHPLPFPVMLFELET